VAVTLIHRVVAEKSVVDEVEVERASSDDVTAEVCCVV